MNESSSLRENALSSIISIWMIICLWKIFVKAGEKGWKAIIPVRDTYIMCKIIGSRGWFWLIMSLPIIGLIWIIGSAVFYIIMLNGSEISMLTLNIFNWILGIASMFFIVITLIIVVLIQVRLGKVFGKSNWFCVGMVFFSFIFWGIIAFDNSKYNLNYSKSSSNENLGSDEKSELNKKLVVKKTSTPKKTIVSRKSTASKKSA